MVRNTTRRPLFGGLFAVASGAVGLLAVANYTFGLIGRRGFGLGDMPPFVPSLIFGLPVPAVIIALAAIAGGIIAVSRKNWTWSLIGAAAAALSFLLLGIPAVVLIVLSRDEFENPG